MITPDDNTLQNIDEHRAEQDCPYIADMNILMINRSYPIVYADDNVEEYTCMDRQAVLSNRGGITSFPGELGFVHITGHRDTQFRRLKELKTLMDNDIEQGILDKCYTVAITYNGYVYYYCIDNFRIEPKIKDGRDNIVVPEVLEEEGSFIFLTTCYPFVYVGNAPYVIIFTGPMFYKHPRN